MAGTDSLVYRGFYDTPHIQDRLRLYGQEEKIFQLLALRQVNPLSILTVLSEKFGVVPASMISDWRFRYQEFDELPYSFLLSAASVRPVSGSLTDYVKLTNSQAAGLNPNHRLQCSGVYVAATVTAHTMVSTTSARATYPLNETVKVVAVGNADSAFEGNAAASGYTWVKISRCYPATAITGQMPAIPISTYLTLINSVARTNQRPNPPVTANGKYLENVVQITRESYGVGEHLTQGGGIKTLLMADGAAQLDMNYQLVETRLMKIIERAIVAGRKFMVEAGNESEYETGGILEFIPAANYIDAGGVLNVQRVNNIVSSALDTSGVRELFMFGGSTYTKNLASAYENKRGFGENTELSVKYGLKVSEITGTGRDGIIYYTNAPILSELGMDNEALILNLTEYNYGEKSTYGAFQIAEKVPMADKPEGAASYESNSGFMGTWRELYYAWGLIRRLAETHLRVYGVS
ncbi:MAG: SU10 major capsid protein [Candidatus Amoebophilus sp.]